MDNLSTILIVDSQPVCRDGLKALAAQRFPSARIDAAPDIETALQVIADHPPGLVLVDVSRELDRPDGLAGLVRAAGPGAVLAIDADLHARRLERVRTCGARGYVAKTSSTELMDAAIALVAAGGEYFPRLPAPEPPPIERLSQRQADVLQGLMQGKSNQQIADDLGISVATVKLHVHAVLSTTGARNRTEAALLALGLLPKANVLPADSPCLRCGWLGSRVEGAGG